MAALILQVWMYSIQDQDAGGWSVSPWKRLIRVRHLSLWCLLFCTGIYTCNCTTKNTKPAQLRQLDCERLQPLEGGICSNHRVITRFRFRMMERCHFVFPWCVTRSRRTEDSLKFPASPLTQHHLYFLLWLAALFACPEPHKSGLQLWKCSSTLISLLKDKIKLHWSHREKLTKYSQAAREWSCWVVLCCVACDAVNTTLASQVRCDIIILRGVICTLQDLKKKTKHSTTIYTVVLSVILQMSTVLAKES